jgi:hypothetical protein
MLFGLGFIVGAMVGCTTAVIVIGIVRMGHD